MIDLLKPLFPGPLAPLAETLQCTPAADDVPLQRLLTDDTALRGLLRRHGACLGTHDLRVAACAWLLHYLAQILPPVMAGLSLLQQRWPLAPQECALRLDADGHTQALVLIHPGVAAPGDSDSRYHALLHHHLAPLIRRLSDTARVPARLLWGNVARRLEGVLRDACELCQQQPLLLSRLRADEQFLLHQRGWPPAQKNPLYAPPRIVEHQGDIITLHRQCCLYYRLPDQGYCTACPLAPEFRKHKPCSHTTTRLQ
jgi:ferric iron reductase protein FhuF